MVVEGRNELLALLREVLYRDPSPSSWRELLGLMSGVESDGEDLEGVVLPYVRSHLSRWPEGLKVLPPSEFVACLGGVGGRPWWWAVARSVDVTVVVEHLMEVRRDDWAVGSPLEGVLEDRRGLLKGLKSLDLSYLRVPDSRTRMAPWAEVSMQGPDDVVRLLSSSGSLEGVECLSLRSVRTEGGEVSISAAGVSVLLGESGLKGLRELDVGDNDIKTQGNIMLMSGCWSGLRRLRVDGCGVEGIGFSGLSEASFAESLEVLDVSENVLGEEGVECLERALRVGCGCLRELHVCGSELPEDGLGRLVSASGGGLRRLVAYECVLGERGYERLRLGLGVDRLECLGLSGTGWSGEEWLGVLRGEEFVGLRELSVSQEDVGELGAWLSEAGLSRLRSLSLMGMRSLSGGLSAWSGRGDLSLQEVDISHCHLGVADCGVLSSAQWMRGLRELSLDGNDIGDEGLRRLLSCGFESLEELSLSGCGLTDESMMALVGSGVLSGLKYLHLGGNKIGAAGLRALLESGECGGLRVLDVSGNPLEAEGGLESVSVWGEMGNLVELHMSLVGAGDDVRCALLDILR